MNTINETVNKVLQTVTKERLTIIPRNTETLAKSADWLGFKTLGDKRLEDMVFACAEWCAALEDGRPPRWITLLGSSGCGKTHLARRLWEFSKTFFEWTACDYLHKEVYWPHFIQELRAGQSFARRSDIQKWPVLFLDDIGAERDTTGFATEELNTMLGCRTGRWTILTANLTLEKMAQVDQRIASRMARDFNTVIQIEAPDYARRVKPAPEKQEIRTNHPEPVEISDEERARGCKMLPDFADSI